MVSAPSGAGKTTLCRALREACPAMWYSISHTTRTPRPGETDGVDYHFTDERAFLRMREKGDLAEWAEVHGHFYGTSAKLLDQALVSGHDILLDIDVQGTIQILKRYPDAVTLFIMAPSLDVLRERLLKRGTEDAHTLEQRLANAEKEIAWASIYRHVIVNDRLPAAIDEFIGIIRQYQT